MSELQSCPCGSGLDYAACCEPFIMGSEKPATAEALMRSRYSAYVKHAIEYIMDSCISKGPRDIDYKATKNWSEKSSWKGLKIHSVEKGGPADSDGIVEFEAVYEIDGLRDIHRERANFIKINDEWKYENGTVAPVTIVRSEPKVGRNEPCPCGSGKKYKHCHGR